MDFSKYDNALPYFSKRENPEGCKAYLAEEARIYEQFKQDLFNDLGIEDNPKRELLFSKAWERGHSAGYHEVYSVAQDLVDLIL